MPESGVTSLSEISSAPIHATDRWHRRGLYAWLPGLVALMWLFALLVCAARLSTLLEVASHFTWQAILGGGLLVVLCGWCRRFGCLALAAVPWIFLVVQFEPLALWFEQPQAPRGNSIKILSWNVLCTNQRVSEIKQVIQAHPADVLVLVEVRPNLFEQIPEIEQLYPHRLAFPSWGGNGIAVLTKRDDVSMERLDLGGSTMPSIVASITTDTSRVKVVGMHTLSPMPPRRAAARDRQLRALVEWAQQQTDPVCVVGDLNITPWAPMFVDLQKAGFFDSRRSGFGNSASWPCWLGPLGIPIDHALSFGQCHFIKRELGPVVFGSDHRPVMTELSY
jgi:endonuclease/exonuclease/phosphatase (EEP) superfamily protein YafD